MIVTVQFKQALCCLAVVVFFSAPAMVFGQADVDGLAAVGTAESEAMANRLRVKLTIKAKGADFEKAIEALEKRRRNAKIKMEKLGVIEDSVKFGSISTGGIRGSVPVAIMPTMMNQGRSNKRLEKMSKVKPPASVQVSVSADWELDAKLDEVEMLIAANKLKRKINAADIESAKEEDDLSAAQEELAEEMLVMAPRFNVGGEAGGAKFTYVRTLPAGDVNKLVADAVADAKKKAQELAVITGVELGAIYGVASRDSSEVSRFMVPYGGGYQEQVSGFETDDDGTLHAVSDSPKVSISRTISLVFRIKE